MSKSNFIDLKTSPCVISNCPNGRNVLIIKPDLVEMLCLDEGKILTSNGDKFTERFFENSDLAYKLEYALGSIVGAFTVGEYQVPFEDVKVYSARVRAALEQRREELISGRIKAKTGKDNFDYIFTIAANVPNQLFYESAEIRRAA